MIEYNYHVDLILHQQKTLHHPTEEQDHSCQYAIAAEVVPLFPVKEKDDNLEMAVHQKCQDLGDEDFPGLSVMVDNVRKGNLAVYTRNAMLIITHSRQYSTLVAPEMHT